ncbi:hypothetical protein, conserved, partial [Babesia bigemina]
MKFDKILNLKITLNNNPTNILNNLCTGLETFLGFNSESKGYDGTGIVYSDLDRLCDGVMGFLYQVLKDVSEKQPYSVGKTILIEIVTELKNNLSTGREGFKFIAQVAGKVGEYNERVKQGNDDMQSVVTKMRNHVETELTKKLNAINENNLTHDPLLSKAVESAQALAKEYGQKGEDFNNGFNNITRDEFSRRSKVELKEQFKDLNSDLRSKINNARDNVSHEANRLTTLSATQKRNLEETIELIKQTCTSLKKCVNDKINKDVTELMNNVEKRVAEILKVLKEIESKIREYIDDLAKWINHADIDVGKAMKDMKGIIDKSIGWQNQDEISGKAKDLSKKATDLYWKFEGAKRSVEEGVDKAKTEKVNELTKWKAAGDAAVKQAKEKCEKVVKKLNGRDKGASAEGGRQKVTDSAQILQQKADELRKKALDAKQKVTTLVREALTAVKTMDEGLKKNLLTVAIKKIETEVNGKDCLENVVRDGNGDDSSKFDGKTFPNLLSTVTANLTAFTDNVRNLVKKENTGTDRDSVHAYLEDVSLLLNSGDP